MSSVPRQLLTPAEYLARERVAEFKSEYYGGELFAMAGSNRRHVRISLNLASVLDRKLQGSGCELFNSDMKVRIAGLKVYTYPDVSIACSPQFEDPGEHVLLNPCVLVEVLSDSTESRDRGWKFRNYWNIPTLVDYLLVAQDRPLVEHFVRRSDGNRMFEFERGLDAVVNLAALDCRIPLREVYAGVDFPPRESPEDEIDPA